MRRLPLYTAALDGASDSMLLVDLDEVKARLELLPWVEEASVGRVLPDRLVVDIKEREPAAIWQHERAAPADRPARPHSRERATSPASLRCRCLSTTARRPRRTRC